MYNAVVICRLTGAKAKRLIQARRSFTLLQANVQIGIQASGQYRKIHYDVLANRGYSLKYNLMYMLIGATVR